MKLDLSELRLPGIEFRSCQCKQDWTCFLPVDVMFRKDTPLKNVRFCKFIYTLNGNHCFTGAVFTYSRYLATLDDSSKFQKLLKTGEGDCSYRKLLGCDNLYLFLNFLMELGMVGDSYQHSQSDIKRYIQCGYESIQTGTKTLSDWEQLLLRLKKVRDFEYLPVLLASDIFRSGFKDGSFKEENRQLLDVLGQIVTDNSDLFSELVIKACNELIIYDNSIYCYLLRKQ